MHLTRDETPTPKRCHFLVSLYIATLKSLEITIICCTRSYVTNVGPITVTERQHLAANLVHGKIIPPDKVCALAVLPYK